MFSNGMELLHDNFIIYSEQLPSYNEFYNNVMKQNKACLFGSKLTEQWKCRNEWLSNNDDSNRINFDYLAKKYGKLTVPVYNCNRKHFNSNPKNEMLFDEYVRYWKKFIENESMEILYLKDWHLVQDSVDDNFYEIPEYFESDYLNEYCRDKQITDFKFVYMGPTGSRTPLHIDVFGSFSWSSNIIGTKRWIMIPDYSIDRLKQLIGSDELPHDLQILPNYREILEKVQGFEVMQQAGEIIFVPSGYLHQVENLTNTISINHNWFNACNLERIFNNLLNALDDVQNEIKDLKVDMNDDGEEWNELCDKILTIHFGMNRQYFLEIIRNSIDNRLFRSSNSNKFLQQQHDFECLKKILKKILLNENFSKKTNDNDRKNLESLEKIVI
ncbi:2-oxoglutarate and iron-dependent oxygenase JMJD4-like [Dermatophagoides pteronyssinus]|uniref:2-oxoglutarate and iron-dependent oxygenase JMJD4-like n=1 Tax=Dermatophagoides pteronyssinus TaxID=6956 RepID=UPI003F68131F